MKQENISIKAMGTRLDIVLVNEDNFGLNDILHEICSEILDLECKLSHFNTESYVSEINRSGKVVLRGEADIYELFLRCVDYCERTNGLFNVFGQNVSVSNITFNDPDMELCIDDENVDVDFGALGKGFALDVVAKIIKSSDIYGALLNFGGSSILATGKRPEGVAWRIGVKSPIDEAVVLDKFELNNSVLSTSSSVRMSGVRKLEKHIVNMNTGELVERIRQVSVLGKSGEIGEFLSTSGILLELEAYKALQSEYKDFAVHCHDFNEKYNNSI
ncbi:MAG: FAD:protein FMN transferase [Bacteroidales bacterium]